MSPVDHVELLVEEPSMEAFLRVVAPQLLGDIPFQVHAYQCKDDLLAKLPARLRGYARWLPPSWRLVVLVDRDDDDCDRLKQRLEAASRDAGLVTRTARRTGYQVVNRVAIEELEAWLFGDWQAVRAAYPRVSATVPAQARYRDPDAIKGGTWEAFERILQRARYARGGLRKIEAARRVASHMDPDRNSSASFRALRDALREMGA